MNDNRADSPNDTRSSKWGAAKKMARLVLLAVLISVTGLAVMSIVGENSVDQVRSGLDSLAFSLFLLRVILYALVINFWEPLTRMVFRKQNWSDDDLANALGKRWQMALWLLGFELLVSGSLLWRLWS
ncbi:MAG: hypothetical protein L3J62_10115 [Gammaproteobacteria bacterium]|nr:hypothetical protein [Gammaproteobacteria bacterium]